jgi:DeoR/GlpR family transcriptional regulator of sugar metabolism
MVPAQETYPELYSHDNTRYCTFMHVEPPIARRDTIAQRLADGQPVSAAPLAQEFAVSEDAIRRDLRALAAAGLCRRVYGGALPLVASARPFAARIDQDAEQKGQLARAAVAMVAPGELIFLDAGSTNLAMIDHLPDDANLTIATNAPDIAAALLRRDDLRTLVIGGIADPLIGGCVDAVAVQAIIRMRFDRVFLGVCAVGEDGIAADHFEDASFKRALVSAGRHVAVLATTDKLGNHAPHQIAPLSQIDTLVISANATPAQRGALDAAGCRALIIAEPAQS